MAFSTYFDVFKVGKVHQRPLWLEAYMYLDTTSGMF